MGIAGILIEIFTACLAYAGILAGNGPLIVLAISGFFIGYLLAIANYKFLKSSTKNIQKRKIQFIIATVLFWFLIEIGVATGVGLFLFYGLIAIF